MSRLVGEALDALRRRPMRQRIAEAAPHLIAHSPQESGAVPEGEAEALP
ncbi:MULTISPECIES: hypothetical protein [unclassified Streptomyces]|uniref:Uncharacterized protein n=1 Tax=Streptomyces sp. NBC_00060 TaxID=2975636 RepID=A0AAU2GRZ1_9ACTN